MPFTASAFKILVFIIFQIKMLGRSILVSLLVICVSAQDRSTNQISRSSFLQDGGQSSWSSLPNNFDVRPHNERTIGSGSFVRNQGSLLQPLNVPDSTDFGSLNLPNRDSNFLFRNQGSNLQSADLGSLNLRNMDSRSPFRNQGSILDPGGIPVSPYSFEPYNHGSFALDGSRFMDITMRGQGMPNGNSRINRNGMLPSRGLNLPNLQSSLLSRSQGLSGFSSDGTSSVLDGRSPLEDGFSGFSTRTPWDRYRGPRAMNAFPFQFSDSRNLNVPPMSMGQRQGLPWRVLNTQNSPRGLGQLGLNHGLEGRIGNGLALNRWNMQRDMSTGPRNSFGSLGVNRPFNEIASSSRSGNIDRPMDDIWVLRNRGETSPTGGLGNNENLMDEIWVSRNSPQNRMRRVGTLSPLLSTSQGSSLVSGLGPRSVIDRSSNLGRLSQLSSNLARQPLASNSLTQPSLTSNIGRTSTSLTSSFSRDLTSGPRTSRTTVYQPTSDSQIVGQRRGAGRISSI